MARDSTILAINVQPALPAAPAAPSLSGLGKLYSRESLPYALGGIKG